MFQGGRDARAQEPALRLRSAARSPSCCCRTRTSTIPGCCRGSRRRVSAGPVYATRGDRRTAGGDAARQRAPAGKGSRVGARARRSTPWRRRRRASRLLRQVEYGVDVQAPSRRALRVSRRRAHPRLGDHRDVPGGRKARLLRRPRPARAADRRGPGADRARPTCCWSNPPTATATTRAWCRRWTNSRSRSTTRSRASAATW